MTYIYTRSHDFASRGLKPLHGEHEPKHIHCRHKDPNWLNEPYDDKTKSSRWFGTMTLVPNNQPAAHLIAELGPRFICYHEFWSCPKPDHETKKLTDPNLSVAVLRQVYCCIDAVLGAGYCWMRSTSLPLDYTVFAEISHNSKWHVALTRFMKLSMWWSPSLH